MTAPKLLGILALVGLGAVLQSQFSHTAGISLARSATANECSADQFKIKGQRAEAEGQRYAKVTGMVYNSCDVPANVELRITLFASNGDVIDSEDLYPSDLENQAPHTALSFSREMSANAEWTKYSIVPIEVRT